MSDSEFNQRHNKCEIIERQKFISLLAEQAWSNSRRGSRRSRNNSMGGTEPCSPDASLQESVLASSVNSSARSSPLPPAELPSPAPVIVRSSDRRRASSAASETLSESADEHFAPVVETWTRRTFPLSDDQVVDFGVEKEDVLQHVEAPPAVVDHSTPQETDGLRTITGTSTPDMESSDGEVADDPNDPEWTVITLDKPKKPVESQVPTKTTLVLKLAKR